MAYLDEYLGTWTEQAARHLLRRTTFAPTHDTISEALDIGLNATVDKLFTPSPTPELPLKYIPDGIGKDELDDPEVHYGETWVNAAVYPVDVTPKVRNQILRYRSSSLYAWMIKQMYKETISITEKMVLFWHNHFVSESQIGHKEYVYQEVLRKHCLGNFKQLTKDITIDTNMLQYLSGYKNTNKAPNENYSREVLELFTVGKGDLVAPGDYTNYTENDIIEMAKVLTGWTIKSITLEDSLTSVFNNNRHTKGSKQLSHRFNNAVIQENGEDEYIDLIDVIFQNDECSRYISRQLYIWFVNHEINADIEENIIEPMSQIIRENNYEIAPAVKTLIKSEHFMNSTACIIKSPIDLILSELKGLGLKIETSSIKEEYDTYLVIYQMFADLEQSIMHHPNVAGWKAYYQTPGYDKIWLNTLLLPKRHHFCKIIMEGGRLNFSNYSVTIPPLVNVIELSSKATNPSVVNDLIDDMVEMLFNYPISSIQKEKLKDIFLDGFTEKDWTDIWNEFVADYTNPVLQQNVDKHLRLLLSAMVQMSEFQVM